MSVSSQNYLIYSLIFTVSVIFGISLLSFMPERFWEKYNLKPIDIFSDMRSDIPTEVILPVENDSDSNTTPNNCKDGLICFEDYSPEKNGLHGFLKKLGDNSATTRIAFFGDSFIEGDIFSGDLRELLQEKFGGQGVGMMPVTSPLNRFRRTVLHDFGGSWNMYSQTDGKKYADLGIAGKVFIPQSNSRVHYAGAKRKQTRDTCQRVSILYKMTGGSGNLSYTINKKITGQVDLISSGKPERADILNDSVGDITLNFPVNPNLSIYGISLENKTGVILDNFSARGTSGTNLRLLSQENLRQTDSLLNYDLVILEYGLNVANNKQEDYSDYQKGMVKTIRHLQSCFPNANFLLIGMPDRSMRKNGTCETMPCVYSMINAQRKICAETEIVFWNLFEAMGGEKSMVAFAESHPPKANKDYTHLTFEGGKHMGSILFETILHEKERYDSKNAYSKKLTE